MFPKSNTCTGKVSGVPLTEYPDEGSARAGAEYASARHGRELVPYRCSRCSAWHLSPAGRQTPSRTSACTDHSGRPKAAYDSRDDAERRAELVRDDGGPRVRAYSCGCGSWHLTSR